MLCVTEMRCMHNNYENNIMSTTSVQGASSVKPTYQCVTNQAYSCTIIICTPSIVKSMTRLVMMFAVIDVILEICFTRDGNIYFRNAMLHLSTLRFPTAVL